MKDLMFVSGGSRRVKLGISNVWLRLIVVTTAVLSLSSVSHASMSSDQTTLVTPTLIGPLSGQTEDGRNVSIAQTPGWRVIYFWSGACPCVTACERYSFLPLAQKYKGRVSFYAVASDGYDLNLPIADFEKQAAQHHLPYTLLRDTTHQIAKYLNAKVTPETFLLDPQGNVVFAGMPDDSRRFTLGEVKLVRGKPAPAPESYLSRALAQALTGKTVTASPIKYDGCLIAW